MKRAIVGFVIVGVLGCGFEDGDYTKQRFGSSALAITNAEGERAVLRTGTALNVATDVDKLKLQPNTIYKVTVTNINTAKEIASAQLLSDMLGKLEISTVAHDLGEFDDVAPNHTLSINIEQPTGPRTGTIVKVTVPVTPHIPDFIGHGFQVDEVQPPHIFSALQDGKAVNAYVVGVKTPDPKEIAAPIYAAGSGFPRGVDAIDLYIVKDGDKWQGKKIPQRGDAEWIVGPVVGKVVDGKLEVTDLGWRPVGKDIGPYDIIADVDRDKQYDYAFSEKDASDGEDKVGLTIQYSAAWFRAKRDSEAAAISAAAAKSAADAAAAAATAAEKAATAPAAKAKAAAARKAANDAKAQWQVADAAAKAAAAAFNRELADAALSKAKFGEAEAASKAAINLAKKAAIDSANAAKAQAAWEKMVASKLNASHLLVNLAFNSRSRSGQWANEYSRSSKIFSYINPPVQRGAKHAFLTKYVVKHQSFSEFWNNPKLLIAGGPGGIGRIKFADKVVQNTGGTVQRSCTNSPPVAIINPQALPVDTVGLLKYDVVFDYGNDGYYDVGVDWLDVVAHRTDGKIVSVSELNQLSDDQIYGFMVSK